MKKTFIALVLTLSFATVAHAQVVDTTTSMTSYNAQQLTVADIISRINSLEAELAWLCQAQHVICARPVMPILNQG